MDELTVLKTACELIKEATADWALTTGSEKEGIWYVAGIMEMTDKLLNKERNE